MYQNRNAHNLINDFKLEIPMYLNSKKFDELIKSIKIKKGIKYLEFNILNIYKLLIKKNFFDKKEIVYLKAWLGDCKKLNDLNKIF